MIIDIEGALIDYFNDNMVSILGHGNSTIGVFRRKFPDDETEGICVYAEIRESHESIYELEQISTRITCRMESEENVFALATNIDNILDRYVHKILNDEVELCLCSRNSGPTIFEGETDNFCYSTALYDMIIRFVGND